MIETLAAIVLGGLEGVPAAIWQTSLVVLAVSVALIVGRRWPAPLRHGLAVVALLKFAIPTALTSPVAILPSVPRPISNQRVETGAPVATTAIPVPHVATALDAASTVEVGTPDATKPMEWLLAIYLAGSFSMLGWIVVSALRLARASRRWTRVMEGALHEELGKLSSQLGPRRPPRLFLSDDVGAPAAFGALVPSIVLPRRFAFELSADDLRGVLAHELAHHRRRDLWTNAMQLLLSVVWWFDPFFWWISRQVRSTREDCCDDLVIGRGFSKATTYCETLLRAARLTSRSTPAGAVLACRFGSHPLHRRVSRLMRTRFRPTTELAPVYAIVLVVLAGAIWPAAATRRSEIQTAASETARRALRSSDPQQRALAARQLGEDRVLSAIPDLVVLLADDSPLEDAILWSGSEWSPALESWRHPSPGETAAISLASMSQDAAHQLIEALEAPQASARRNSAWALGELHHPRLPELPEVPPLIRALQDVDAGVRAASAWALGETKDRRATRPLVTALVDEEAEVRAQAAHALGEIADPNATDALLDALEDTDRRVRKSTSWALDEIRDKIRASARRQRY